MWADAFTHFLFPVTVSYSISPQPRLIPNSRRSVFFRSGAIMVKKAKAKKKGVVQKIIKQIDEPEKAEIRIDGADELYRDAGPEP
jgi:hypothetical protein